MMLFKLSIQNLKKSLRDYAVYFATLIIGVSIFYVFNSMEKQTIMMKASAASYEIIDLMNRFMAGVSVFVAFVLGCLIVYASNFLMKRRKREFGIYMLLGMEKGKIARILMTETVIIGIVSLGVGLTAGIIASQGMSILVAKLFEADMTKFTFVISNSAIGKTVGYFLLMYLVVMLLDTVVVGRAKLIDLIQAGKKTEKNTAKNPVLCAVVFTAAVILLGSAYYAMTAGVGKVTTNEQFLWQIGKGVIATFLIFWSMSGLLFFFASKCRRYYLKGLNCFTIRELGGRINTTVISGSIICLMLFITICILSSAMSMRKNVNDNLKEMLPVDVNFDVEVQNDMRVADIFAKTGVDIDLFTDVADISTYTAEDGSFTMAYTMGQSLYEMNLNKSILSYYEEMRDEVIKISDYNKIAELYGIKKYTLESDEYMIVADYDSMVSMRNMGLKSGQTIEIGGKEYHAKYEECQPGYLEIASNHINFGFFLVPDDVNLDGFKEYHNYYAANYSSTETLKREETEKYIDSAKFSETVNPVDKEWPSVQISSKTKLTASSIGLTAMVIFIGVYLGIVFMIASAAVLALKELSEAVDNREKYATLRRIGVDEKQINRSLFAQSAIFFGIPLVFACIHSVFGIQTCNYILETFGTTGLLYSILTTAVMIVLIYGMYFMITYICSKKIIRDKR